MKLPKDLREFIELLNSHGVDYILVGGYAMAFHTRPRFTEDIDLLVRPTLENGSKIEAVLKEFSFTSLGLRASEFEKPNQVIQLGNPPNRIDLITTISGVTFDEAWRDRQPGELDGIHVAFLSRDCMLRNKAATGRDKDLEDVKRLEDP
ncbi:MAG: nucleotidyltransferase family protein [bacterium]|nr:nucleotidyltransferase family protein [bacterium]